MKLRRRTARRLYLWGLRAAISVLMVGVYSVYAFTDIFTITIYEVVGLDNQTRKEIISDLEKASTGKRFFIFPNNKIFTYSSNGIISIVRKHAPDIATIDMRPIGLHGVRITTTLLAPVMRLPNGNVIDTTGIIFGTKNVTNVYPLLTLASSTQVSIKSHGLPFSKLVMNGIPLDPVLITELLLFIRKVDSIIFPVKEVIIEDIGDVTLLSQDGVSKVLFLGDADFKKVWTILVSALDTDPLKSKFATNRSGLQYLDVRYGNKVFYRFDDMPFQNNDVTGIIHPYASSTATTSIQAR